MALGKSKKEAKGIEWMFVWVAFTIKVKYPPPSKILFINLPSGDASHLLHRTSQLCPSTSLCQLCIPSISVSSTSSLLCLRHILRFNDNQFIKLCRECIKEVYRVVGTCSYYASLRVADNMCLRWGSIRKRSLYSVYNVLKRPPASGI